jgi:hypothetical protein
MLEDLITHLFVQADIAFALVASPNHAREETAKRLGYVSSRLKIGIASKN